MMMKKYDEMAFARKENSFQFSTSTTLEEYMDSDYPNVLNAFLYDDEVCFFISNKYIINFLSYTKEFQRFSCLIKELNSIIYKICDFDKISTEEFFKKLNLLFSKETYLESLLKKINKQVKIIINKLLNLSNEIDEFNEYYLNGKNIKYSNPTTYVCEIEKEEMKNKALLKEKILNNNWRMVYNDYNLYILKDQDPIKEFSKFLYKYYNYNHIFSNSYKDVGFSEEGKLYFNFPIFDTLITKGLVNNRKEILNSLYNNGYTPENLSNDVLKKQITDSTWIYFEIFFNYTGLIVKARIYQNKKPILNDHVL